LAGLPADDYLHLCCFHPDDRRKCTCFHHEIADGRVSSIKTALKDHREAVKALLQNIQNETQVIQVYERGMDGIGHRVVHGGEYFNSSVVINEKTRAVLEDLKKLAPFHNPPNLAGIDICSELLPEVRQVAVFDTAFHQTMPDHAFTYALPYRYYQVFTAGIGEHSPEMRERICQFLSWLDLHLDEEKNKSGLTEGLISGPGSRVEVLIVPTDEEWIIAQETALILGNRRGIG
jgi:acetate kinase